MKKIITALLTMLITAIPVKADNISKIFHKSHINEGAVSLSVKDINTGAVIYNLNSKTPRNPASTLKLITTAASVDVLGYDYKYSTKLYKSAENILYMKLGADPFLKSSDLNDLMKTASGKNIKEPKKIYVDNSLFDSTEWGEGWQWDDDLNPLMPKFSAYNLDNNLLNIEVIPAQNGRAPSISVNPFYPVTIMNLIKTDYTEDNNIKAERNNSIAPNIINLSGTVSKQEILNLPVNNPRVYFNLRLNEAIQNAKIEYDGSLLNAKLPAKNVYLVDEVKHDLGLSETLKDSNNLVAETNFKLAGAKYAKARGSLTNSLNMLNAYFKKIGLNNDDARIVDGSGVSKNNLVTADFMTDFLIKISQEENFEKFKSYMPVPGEGTLRNRMLYFKENLSAKTGTLANASAIAGYIKTRRGKIYAFDIMIEDAKTSAYDKKNIEEQILRQIYMN